MNRLCNFMNGKGTLNLRGMLLNLMTRSAEIVQGSAAVKVESSKDIVTSVDLAISRMATDFLLCAVPDLCVETEELGISTNSSKERWYAAVDDLDGTDNYYRGNGMLPYCTCICVFKGRDETQRPDGARQFQDIIAGCCIEHLSGTIFFAERGQGTEILDSCLNPVKISQPEPSCRGDRTTRILTDLYGGKPGRLVRLLETIWPKDFSSSALHYCMAAAGLFDGLVFETNKAHELGLAYIFSKENGRWLSDFSLEKYDQKPYVFSGSYEVLMAHNRDLATILSAMIV